MMKERIAPIRLLLLDVDGVLTDGRIVFDANGIESKFFNVKDGHGIKMLQRAGITVGIISGRESQVAANRAAELGIDLVYQKSLDKMIPYRDILAKTGFTDRQVAFIGDDIIDGFVLSGDAKLAESINDRLEENTVKLGDIRRDAGMAAVDNQLEKELLTIQIDCAAAHLAPEDRNLMLTGKIQVNLLLSVLMEADAHIRCCRTKDEKRIAP